MSFIMGGSVEGGLKPQEVSPHFVLEGKTDGVSPTVHVRWGLTETGREQVVKLHKQYPRVLLFVYEQSKRGYSSEEEIHLRQLHMVDACEAYIRLPRAGKFHIYAMLVSSGSQQRKGYRAMIATLMGRERQRLGNLYSDVAILDHYWIKTGPTDHTQTWRTNCYHRDKTYIVVEVSKDCFAKKPPGWMTRIVQYANPTPIVDSCDLRRRFMVSGFSMAVAFAFVGIAIVIFVLLRLILSIFGLALGYRISRDKEVWFSITAGLDDLFVEPWSKFKRVKVDDHIVYRDRTDVMVAVLNPWMWWSALGAGAYFVYLGNLAMLLVIAVCIPCFILERSGILERVKAGNASEKTQKNTIGETVTSFFVAAEVERERKDKERVEARVAQASVVEKDGTLELPRRKGLKHTLLVGAHAAKAKVCKPYEH